MQPKKNPDISIYNRSVSSIRSGGYVSGSKDQTRPKLESKDRGNAADRSIARLSRDFQNRDGFHSKRSDYRAPLCADHLLDATPAARWSN